MKTNRRLRAMSQRLVMKSVTEPDRTQVEVPSGSHQEEHNELRRRALKIAARGSARRAGEIAALRSQIVSQVDEIERLRHQSNRKLADNIALRNDLDSANRKLAALLKSTFTAQQRAIIRIRAFVRRRSIHDTLDLMRELAKLGWWESFSLTWALLHENPLNGQPVVSLTGEAPSGHGGSSQ